MGDRRPIMSGGKTQKTSQRNAREGRRGTGAEGGKRKAKEQGNPRWSGIICARKRWMQLFTEVDI